MSHGIDIEKLSPEERLALLEEIWDSLDHVSVPLTASQREELDRRIDVLESEHERTAGEDSGRARGQ